MNAQREEFVARVGRLDAPASENWAARFRYRLAAIFAAALSAGPVQAAETIVVGPGGTPGTFAEALGIAREGDTIAILPGEYRGDVAVIAHKRLTIRGIGRRPVFVGDGKIAEGKAIWVVRDGKIDIDNIEFRGARANDGNGAGIRFERGRLKLTRCAFFDNESGVLTSNVESAELRIENSEFGKAPLHGTGLRHLLYVGRIAKLQVQGSRFHQGARGHLIKSRARESRIAYNLIVDGPRGTASYEIDLPNGGVATLIGNVIGQGAASENNAIVAYGAEGSHWERNQLDLSHNTLLNEQILPASFLRVWTNRLPPGLPIRAINNLTVGTGFFTFGLTGTFEGNQQVARNKLVDPDHHAFELGRDSGLRGRTIDPASLAIPELVPKAEFALPIGTVPIAAPSRWSPGAFQR